MAPHTFRSRVVGSERGYPHYEVSTTARKHQELGTRPEARVLSGHQVAAEDAIRNTCKNPWWHTRSQRRPGHPDGIRASLAPHCDNPSEVVVEGKRTLHMTPRWAGETKNTKGPRWQCRVDDRPNDDPVREFKRGEYYNKTIDHLRHFEKQYELHPTRDFGHMGNFERHGTIYRDYGKDAYRGARNNNIGCSTPAPWLKTYKLQPEKHPGRIQEFFGTR